MSIKTNIVKSKGIVSGDYPLLKINKRHDIIVLFTSSGVGMIVYHPIDKYNLFVRCGGFDESQYDIYDGIIELQNEILRG